VPVLVGRGVVVGIGTSVRGPAMRLYGIAASSPSLIRKTYYEGPLKEGLETAAGQGCSIVYGMRVMGENYATAELEVTDAALDPAGKFIATGPGAWGNIPSIKIEDGDYSGTKKETFAGNGADVTTPYALLYDDLIESTVNYVKVAGTAKTVIYTGTPDPGEALLDKAAGELSFAAGEWPTTAQLVEIRYKYNSRKITLQDEVGLPIVYNNITSLSMLAAKMKKDNICTFEVEVGATHLPQNMVATNMAGGSDGSAITSMTGSWPSATSWSRCPNRSYQAQYLPRATRPLLASGMLCLSWTSSSGRWATRRRPARGSSRCRLPLPPSR